MDCPTCNEHIDVVQLQDYATCPSCNTRWYLSWDETLSGALWIDTIEEVENDDHATSDQMAEVMEWTWMPRLQAWLDADGLYHEHFNPTADLNHAALVEQRLKDLGLEQQYLEVVLFHEGNPTNMTEAFKRLLFASAQTRCDAAWQAWQQWKTETQP